MKLSGVQSGVRTDDSVIRVLVVDDHQFLRRGLVHMLFLEPGMLVVGEAATGRVAVDLARQTRPDVIIMDINMPEMNGIEATRLITSENPHVRVIGLSMHNEGNLCQTVMEAGACAYISKGCAPQELIAAIRRFSKKAPARERNEAPISMDPSPQKPDLDRMRRPNHP